MDQQFAIAGYTGSSCLMCAIDGADIWQVDYFGNRQQLIGKTAAAHMVNEDGTTGPHWPMEQTTALAESMGLSWDHITPWCWWVTMNMMYSDYGSVAIHYGVSTAEFFAELAQAFLFDKDGPGTKAKLAAYYHGIVKAGEQD